jgi:hypothetical protein
MDKSNHFVSIFQAFVFYKFYIFYNSLNFTIIMRIKFQAIELWCENLNPSEDSNPQSSFLEAGAMATSWQPQGFKLNWLWPEPGS